MKYEGFIKFIIITFLNLLRPSNLMISNRAKKLHGSSTVALNTKANDMLSQGIDLAKFTAGEPDFAPPENVKKAAIKAIKEDLGKYTATAGMPELREAIIKKFKRDNGLDYHDTEVMASNGGKHILDNLFRVLINPGDEVIIPVPYWVSYPEQVKLSGGTPVFCNTDDLKITAKCIKEKITKKTKAIVLNYPNNPSGMSISKDELKKIADLAVKNDLVVISDEVYELLLYKGKHVSIAGLNSDIFRRTVIVNSLSKTYAMTGWRLGYAAGPSEIITAMVKMQGQGTSCPNTIAQYAAIEALTGKQDCIENMKKEYVKRRDYIVKRLDEMKNISCTMPDGAFYAFPCIKKTGLKSEEFCKKLLEEALVAAVPGTGFGMEGHIRLSYATSMDIIEKGMDRMKEFCDSLN